MAPNALLRQRVWVDGFAMRTHPVSVEEWRRWLSEAEIVLSEAENTAVTHWPGDWPAVMMSWAEAVAFAAWTASRTGRPWRLPAELEREKAARGVDGRVFPWGDRFDPTWCCMADSRDGDPRPAARSEFLTDQSPYGARGLAGNVREWCLDPYRRQGPRLDGQRLILPDLRQDLGADRTIRGGAWNNAALYCRAAYRYGFSPEFRFQSVGLRLVRSLAAPAAALSDSATTR